MAPGRYVPWSIQYITCHHSWQNILLCLEEGINAFHSFCLEIGYSDQGVEWGIGRHERRRLDHNSS